MRSFRRKHARFKLRAEDRERLGPELADRRVRPLALEKLRDALNRGLLTRHAILSAQRVTENCVIAWRLYILFALCQARSGRVWWVQLSTAYPWGRSDIAEPSLRPLYRHVPPPAHADYPGWFPVDPARKRGRIMSTADRHTTRQQVIDA